MNVTLEDGKVLPPLSLRGFCEAVISEDTGSWPPDEDVLAEKFVAFFRLGPFPRLAELETLCRKLGVEVALAKLPPELRGHNCSYQSRKEIVITDTESVSVLMGSREHTLLHELRELLEYEFVALGKPITTGADLETRAEEFASCTRLVALAKGWEPMVKGAMQIQSTFWSIGAIVALALVFLLYGYACVSLPRLEDHAGS